MHLNGFWPARPRTRGSASVTLGFPRTERGTFFFNSTGCNRCHRICGLYQCVSCYMNAEDALGIAIEKSDLWLMDKRSSGGLQAASRDHARSPQKGQAESNSSFELHVDFR